MAYYYERIPGNIRYSSWQMNRAQIFVIDTDTKEQVSFIITDKNKNWNLFTSCKYHHFVFDGNIYVGAWGRNNFKNIKILDNIDYAEWFI